MATECKDKNCPIHGTIRVRGGVLIGKVVSAKMKNTVVVERDTTKYFSKYKRWAKERSRILAHNSDCIGARLGDIVKIGETRKISKRKAWAVIDVIKRGEVAA